MPTHKSSPYITYLVQGSVVITLCLFVLYVYLVVSIVYNAVHRLSIIRQTRSLGAQLAALEGEFSQVVSSISDVSLQASGLERVSKFIHVPRRDGSIMYSILYEK